MYTFSLHCNTQDILEKERDKSAPGNDFNTSFNFTDNLQYSSGFRHTLNQSSMVYGN